MIPAVLARGTVPAQLIGAPGAVQGGVDHDAGVPGRNALAAGEIAQDQAAIVEQASQAVGRGRIAEPELRPIAAPFGGGLVSCQASEDDAEVADLADRALQLRFAQTAIVLGKLMARGRTQTRTLGPLRPDGGAGCLIGKKHLGSQARSERRRKAYHHTQTRQRESEIRGPKPKAGHLALPIPALE